MTRRTWLGARERLAARRDRLRLALEEREDRLARFDEARHHYDDERLVMGRHSYGRPRVATFPGDTGSVRVGAFCSIAMDVILMDGGNHRSDWVSTFPFRAAWGLPGAYQDGHPATKGDIEIGNDVWIGREARIQSGVTVGDGAVVAGYSVVTKDVRPYAIVAGNPAREIRRRFADETVAALLRIAWWNWDDATIRERVPLLCSADVDAFVERFDPGSEG